MSELVRRAESQGLAPEDLDEVIHDLKGREASEINNGGLEAQVEYLVNRLGGREAGEAINEIARGLGR